MGKYDLVKIEESISSCIDFLRSVNCDVYTRAFWLCSLWMLLAARISGTNIVNNSTTRAVYNDAICKYRNAYVHNDSLRVLFRYMSALINSVQDNYFVYAEIASSVEELRKFVSKMEEM